MNLLFRTDASLKIGTGHVMRCLALAQAWQDAGGSAMFAMAEATPAIQARVAAESCGIVPVSAGVGTEDDSAQTIAWAGEGQAAWIVVDGYQFDGEYQRRLKAAGFKLLFLDDYGHAAHYSADFVLNQNVSANQGLYADREGHTCLLLGPRYCLLRREFAAWRKWTRKPLSVGRRVLVTLGGSDPGNMTLRVVDALKMVRLKDLEATILVGGSNPLAAMIEKAAARSGPNITVKHDATNVAELMAAADVAVSGAGSTCWELCRMGLPALLVDLAANQTPLASELERRGCAVHVGDQATSMQKIAQQLERLLGSHELRQSLSQRAQELVDGWGTSRVVSVLQRTERLRLRPVRAEDSRLLWEWANDPQVRAASFSSAPIPWETHVAWFAQRLGPEKTLIFIAEDEAATPCGQIRFDARTDGDWETDISMARGWRGCGLAGDLLRLGMHTMEEKGSNLRFHAFVKPANLASVKMFGKAGFKKTGTEQLRGHEAIHFIYERE